MPNPRLIVCLRAIEAKLELLCVSKPSDADKKMMKPNTVSNTVVIKKNRSIFLDPRDIMLTL